MEEHKEQALDAPLWKVSLATFARTHRSCSNAVHLASSGTCNQASVASCTSTNTRGSRLLGTREHQQLSIPNIANARYMLTQAPIPRFLGTCKMKASVQGEKPQRLRQEPLHLTSPVHHKTVSNGNTYNHLATSYWIPIGRSYMRRGI